MQQYKVCFWLNAPSNHQTLFLEALNQNEQVDLKVRYFLKPSKDRLKLGWRDGGSLYQYEKYVDNLDDALNCMTDWKDCIHILTGYSQAFNRDLLPLLIKNNIRWIHWSERYGVTLAAKLNYSIWAFKIARPFFLLLTKRFYGKLVDRYAMGCFALGELAQRDFKLMGIQDSKISDLFYTTEHFAKTKQSPSELQCFPYKYKFLFCGKLDKRKGINDLLYAFSQLSNADDWGVVLVGRDTTDGYFQRLALKLGIENKVLFVGMVQAEYVNTFYSHCDVFILPSRFDGWGAVLNEAASYGMPLISTDQCGAAHHLITKSGNGQMVKAGNIKELASAMALYIMNISLIAKHGEKSKAIYNDFTAEKNVNRFITSIKQWSYLD